jgi:hypothetical protein
MKKNMKGGSIASDSVTGLVKQDGWGFMDNNADNVFDSVGCAQQSGGKKPKGPKGLRSTKGGTAANLSTVPNATNATIAALAGGPSDGSPPSAPSSTTLGASATPYSGGGSKKGSKSKPKSKKSTAMKGGSIASDSVVAKVDPNAFSVMDANFDNTVPCPSQAGGRKKSKKSTKQKAGCANCKQQNCKCAQKAGSSDIWNNVMTELSQHFTATGGMGLPEPFIDRNQVIHSEPAPTNFLTYTPKAIVQEAIVQEAIAPESGAVGGGKRSKNTKSKKTTKSPKLKGGFSDEFGKNIHEYMNNDEVNVFNKKKGGACSRVQKAGDKCTPVPIPIGLDYSRIQSADASGVPFTRSMSPEVMEAITNASVSGSSVQGMNKVVEFGNMTNSGLAGSFSYGGLTGGKKKSTSKKTKSKPKKK